MSPTLFPNGFRISGIPVAASFAHPNSFQLTPDNHQRDDTCIDASAALGGRAQGFAKYWEEGTVVSEMVFEVEADEKKHHSKKGKEKEKEREKDKRKERSKDASSKGEIHCSVLGLVSCSVLTMSSRWPSCWYHGCTNTDCSEANVWPNQDEVLENWGWQLETGPCHRLIRFVCVSFSQFRSPMY